MVVKHLSKEYASLSQAEASLKIDYVSGNDIICNDSVNYGAFTTGTPQLVLHNVQPSLMSHCLLCFIHRQQCIKIPQHMQLGI